jgi:outer membrane protein
MKKLAFTLLLLLTVGVAAHAQKFAMIDMEYILKNIPAYQQANDQLSKASDKWQAEIEQKKTEAKKLYESYQQKVSTLSDAQRKQQEDAVIAKEKEMSDLQRKYFGNDGEMYKLQQSLMQPIQDDVYNAVKAIAEYNGYAAVVDRASANSVIFASPDIDISDEVLNQLGYSN